MFSERLLFVILLLQLCSVLGHGITLSSMRKHRRKCPQLEALLELSEELLSDADGGRGQLADPLSGIDDEQLREYQQVCHPQKDCACQHMHIMAVSDDVCGWCESTSKMLVGSINGPIRQEGSCDDWVFAAQDCNTMWCSEWQEETNFWLKKFFPSVIFFGIFVVARLVAPPDKPPPQLSQDIVLCKRSLNQFKKGLRGLRVTAPRTSYVKGIEGLDGVMSTGRALLFSDVAKKALLSATMRAFIATIIMACVQVAPLWMESHNWREFRTMLQQLKVLTADIGGIFTLMFTLYFLFRLAWWWSMLSMARNVQVPVQDLAAFVGSQSPVGAMEAWVSAKFELFRYLMLTVVYTFPRKHDMGKLNDAVLEELGFLTGAESEVLLQSLVPKDMVLRWVGIWIESNIPQELTRLHMHDKLSSLRTAGSHASGSLTVRAPWVFENLLYLMAHLVILLLMVVAGHPPPDDPQIEDPMRWMTMPQMLPACFVLVVTGYFLVALELIDGPLKDPFDTTIDSARLETLFLETEVTIWESLSVEKADKDKDRESINS